MANPLLAKLLLEVIMKFAPFLSFLGPNSAARPDEDFELDLEEIEHIQNVKPWTPFAALEDHLAELVATETEARAAHEDAVRDLEEYLATLKSMAETHQASISSLYAQTSPQVNVEKVK